MSNNRVGQWPGSMAYRAEGGVVRGDDSGPNSVGRLGGGEAGERRNGGDESETHLEKASGGCLVTRSSEGG